MEPDIITIIIPPGMWRDVDGDATLLKCVININGTFMHLEAIQVHTTGPENLQQPVNDDHRDSYDLLCQYGTEGQFETTEINGKKYVLVATPFAW